MARRHTISGASGLADPSGPLKIVILGEGRVGKTSLLRRYVKRSFDDGEVSTQHAAYLERTLTINGQQVQLSLWDTAGQERFHSLAPMYYRDAMGALLVYDVTDIESFTRVAKWVEELQTQGKECALAVVGNKADLRQQAKVPEADAQAYAHSIGASHGLTSAKMGLGVEEAFQRLAEEALQRRSKMAGELSAGAGASFPQGRRSTRTGALLIADDARGSSEQVSRSCARGGCCGGGGAR